MSGCRQNADILFVDSCRIKAVMSAAEEKGETGTTNRDLGVQLNADKAQYIQTQEKRSAYIKVHTQSIWKNKCFIVHRYTEI